MGTIVVSSFFRGRDAQRLTASEHLLAGAIRQARHTARSSGMPVALRLESTMVNNERVGITMSGQFRVPIWTETFDGEGKVIESPLEPDEAGKIGEQEKERRAKNAGLVVGRSGNGKKPGNYPYNGNQYGEITYSFQRGQSFNRKSDSTSTDGFFMSCSVRPNAPVFPDNYTDKTISIGVPLMIIGMAPNFENAQAVLELRCRLNNPKVPLEPGEKPLPAVWEVFGQVFAHNDRSQCSVSSKYNWQSLLHAAVESSSTNTDDIPFIVEPDRWIELGLLYDGKRLYLYANGRPIAVQYNIVPKKLADGTRCYVGQYTHQDGTVAYTNLPFDDIRISKLGQNDAMAFPDGVIFSNNVFGYRIMCHSNGRVEVFKDQSQNVQNDAARAENDNNTQLISGKNASDPSISLEQRLVPGTIQKTEITVSLDGRVTSRLITAPVNAPKTEPK
jgi:hypothetical protein